MRGRSSGMTLDRPASVAHSPNGNGRTPGAASGGAAGPGAKRDRQLAIRELVASESIGSQQELADRLIDRGFGVTQATVSRDIAELGLLKAPRAGHSVYVLPEALAGSRESRAVPAAPTDERLRRILADIPVSVGRSGLILLVTGSPGTASVIAQAIDESSLTEQEGTLAGDNTLLVLFADEERLLAWRGRFDQIRSSVQEARPS